ncbi:hypothetical protein BDC45DRAFT_586246 [Circinella umbellata]|nr:hypothetical protein BDC45DRAFT_586246 [Circinella umbellata]
MYKKIGPFSACHHFFEGEKIRKAANSFRPSRVDVLKVELRQTNRTNAIITNNLIESTSYMKLYKLKSRNLNQLSLSDPQKTALLHYSFLVFRIISTNSSQVNPTSEYFVTITIDKPAPAIIDTTTSAAVTPSARLKKVHPVPTYSHSSTTIQPPNKKRKHVINKSACIQHSCVINITEASKFFQFSDHNRTKFEYIHIPCLKRKTRQEIRQLFCNLKINTSRVLDISYPGRNIIGILVHQH